MSTAPLPAVVVVNHQGGLIRTLETGLATRARVIGVSTVAEAELAMIREQAAVLVCRDDLPGETGIMFLSRYRAAYPWQRRILVCPPLDSELAMMLINETNIFRCVPMPSEPASLVPVIEAALEESGRIQELFHAETENTHLRQQLAAAESRTPAARTRDWLRALPRFAAIVAGTFASVLVLGAVTLLLLYLLKTVLGIDIFANGHLTDAIK